MRPNPGTASLLAVAALLVACATAPVDQIRHFSQAFNSVNTVGQPLLDDLAVAERAQGRRVAVARAKRETQDGKAACTPHASAWQPVPGSDGFIRGFCPQDAAYFSDLADPPATAALRGALHLVERYAEILSALAEGRNIDEALGQVDALAKNLSGLLSVAGGPAAPLGLVLAPLQPILEHAARQSNAAEARRLIVAGAPHVSKVITGLRDAVPPMFNTLISRSAIQLTAEASGSPAAAAPELARIAAYRQAVADYAVLLDRLQSAWELAAAAAAAPSGGSRTLVSLVQQTSALKADAEAARRALAALRTGVPGR